MRTFSESIKLPEYTTIQFDSLSQNSTCVFDHTTATMFSLFLGSLGFDRFYLGDIVGGLAKCIIFVSLIICSLYSISMTIGLSAACFDIKKMAIERNEYYDDDDFLYFGVYLLAIGNMVFDF
eukprot:gene4583-7967_t